MEPFKDVYKDEGFPAGGIAAPHDPSPPFTRVNRRVATVVNDGDGLRARVQPQLKLGARKRLYSVACVGCVAHGTKQPPKEATRQ